MDLILWRHAEAHDNEDGRMEDLDRTLTLRGEKQAARMAIWLNHYLPQGLRIFASPACRTEQTVQALGRKYKLRAELLPDGQGSDLLELVQWPRMQGPVLVVGHQPMLGQAIARALGLSSPECSVRKGAVWWLRHRRRLELDQTILVTVQSPELLS